MAYEGGINFFDTAELYGLGEAEKIFGEAFKELNVNRNNLVITTKLFWSGFTKNAVGNCRKKLMESMTASLKRMQLEYVDVVYSHRPDYETPLREICMAFHSIIEKGQAFYWGTSEWRSEMIMEAI